MRIILQPVLFQLDKEIFSKLEKTLLEEFNGYFIITASPIKEAPKQLLLFDKQRNQWNSDAILQWLSNTCKPYSKSTTTKIHAICDFDAYSDQLNFVFGQAHMDGSISAIYLPRLRQQFYGLNSDASLFCQRLVKEAVHELGHAFGLNHCKNSKCVMHFSNSLSDIDIKTSHFCNVCKGFN